MKRPKSEPLPGVPEDRPPTPVPSFRKPIEPTVQNLSRDHQRLWICLYARDGGWAPNFLRFFCAGDAKNVPPKLQQEADAALTECLAARANNEPWWEPKAWRKTR